MEYVRDIQAIRKKSYFSERSLNKLSKFLITTSLSFFTVCFVISTKLMCISNKLLLIFWTTCLRKMSYKVRMTENRIKEFTGHISDFRKSWRKDIKIMLVWHCVTLVTGQELHSATLISDNTSDQSEFSNPRAFWKPFFH